MGFWSFYRRNVPEYAKPRMLADYGVVENDQAVYERRSATGLRRCSTLKIQSAPDAVHHSTRNRCIKSEDLVQ